LQPFDEAFAQVRIEETYDKDANLVKRVENGRKFLISLGCRIRNCRLSRGWTQEDLSERAGLSAKYIGEVERGEKQGNQDHKLLDGEVEEGNLIDWEE